MCGEKELSEAKDFAFQETVVLPAHAHDGAKKAVSDGHVACSNTMPHKADPALMLHVHHAYMLRPQVPRH